MCAAADLEGGWGASERQPMLDGGVLQNDDVRGLAGFSHQSVRSRFVRKVYSILAVQILATTAIAWGFCAEPIKQALIQMPALAVIAPVLLLVLSLAMICVPRIMRSYPSNYILLGAYTVLMAAIVGIVVAFSSKRLVFMALAMTCLMVAALTAFAFQTTYDFTGMGPYLYAVAIGLSITSLVTMCLSFAGVYFKWLEVLTCGIGVILFSMYLIYDTQLIIGKKHSRFEFAVDDYCFAAIMLYIDIIQIFIDLLRLLQLLSDRH